MQVTIPDDRRVVERARAAGFASVDEYVRELVNRDVHASETPPVTCDPQNETNEAWIRDFRAFIQSLPSHNPDFDDSRESIYPVR